MTQTTVQKGQLCSVLMEREQDSVMTDTETML